MPIKFADNEVITMIRVYYKHSYGKDVTAYASRGKLVNRPSFHGSAEVVQYIVQEVVHGNGVPDRLVTLPFTDDDLKSVVSSFLSRDGYEIEDISFSKDGISVTGEKIQEKGKKI